MTLQDRCAAKRGEQDGSIFMSQGGACINLVRKTHIDNAVVQKSTMLLSGHSEKTQNKHTQTLTVYGTDRSNEKYRMLLAYQCDCWEVSKDGIHKALPLSIVLPAYKLSSLVASDLQIES